MVDMGTDWKYFVFKNLLMGNTLCLISVIGDTLFSYPYDPSGSYFITPSFTVISNSFDLQVKLTPLVTSMAAVSISTSLLFHNSLMINYSIPS